MGHLLHIADNREIERYSGTHCKYITVEANHNARHSIGVVAQWNAGSFVPRLDLALTQNGLFNFR